MGFLWWLLLGSLVAQTVKNLPECRRRRFDPWVGKIPWRRERQPTPVFLSGEFHGQRGKESDMTKQLSLSTFSYCGFSSCSTWAQQLWLPVLENSLKSCGTQTWLLCVMWDFLKPGIKLVSPALAGRFFISKPPGKHKEILSSSKKKYKSTKLLFCHKWNFSDKDNLN